MAVTSTNLIQGPGDLYKGDFGATEPLATAIATAPSATDWDDVGGTKDGVTMNIAQEYSELEVDQIVDIPGRRLTKREFTLETNLAEATLENLALATNSTDASVATAAGPPVTKSFDPETASSATQPTYRALIFDGFAPNSMRRRVIVRKALSTEDVEFAYKKDDQTVFSVTFAAHYVSSSIKPFKIVDES